MHRPTVSVVVALGFVVGSAAAQGEAPPISQRPVAASDWEFSLTPYAWFTTIGNANVGVPSVGAGGIGGGGGGGGGGKGEEFLGATTFGLPGGGGGGGGAGSSLQVDDDSSFFEDVGISPNVVFEARLAPWSFFLDLSYLKPDSDANTSTGADATLDFEAWSAEIGAGYEVASWETSAGGRGGRLDVLLGLRGTTMDSRILAAGGTDVKVESEWVDVMVGARASCEFVKDWTVKAGVEIGGFGIGGSNDFTWEANVGVGWAAAPTVDVDLGYRVLGLHRDEDEVDFDLVFHGPSLGVSIRF